MHQSFEIPASPTSGLPEAKARKSPCFHHFNQGRRKQMDIGGAGNSENLGGSGGMHPQIILKSRTPEIRFPASWEVIFYRKAHYKLEVWERVDRN